MASETKFTRAEVKFLYRAFKQECPNGIIDEETFKEVYAKIFPLGDASKYAHLVFCAIDKEKTGGITFGDFMDFLSTISKGSTEEKILWSFHFYDVNKDGHISKEEMVKVGVLLSPPSTSVMMMMMILMMMMMMMIMMMIIMLMMTKITVRMMIMMLTMIMTMMLTMILTMMLMMVVR